MVSTFTPNVQIEQPARGDDVGTWDTPVNNNMSLIDLIVGGITTIGLNNSNVQLSASQFKSRQLIFNSTLTGSVTITFPTSFTKNYEIYHTCTGSSAFTITLATTATGGQVICAPPGETITVVNDGTNLRYMNLGRIGTYWDYCGSSVPNWVSGCTVPPYLNCNAGSFSSSTYPQLANILGGTTLPDSRSNARLALDQGAGRLGNIINGTVVGSLGGTEIVVLNINQIPPHNHGYTDPGHNHNGPGIGVNNGINFNSGSGAGAILIQGDGFNHVTGGSGVGITIANTGGGGFHSNTQPSYIGGLTFIRAG